MKERAPANQLNKNFRFLNVEINTTKPFGKNQLTFNSNYRLWQIYYVTSFCYYVQFLSLSKNLLVYIY